MKHSFLQCAAISDIQSLMRYPKPEPVLRLLPHRTSTRGMCRLLGMICMPSDAGQLISEHHACVAFGQIRLTARKSSECAKTGNCSRCVEGRGGRRVDSHSGLSCGEARGPPCRQVMFGQAHGVCVVRYELQAPLV